MPETIDVRVAHRYRVAEDIICLELTPLSSPALPAFQPGAHIDIHLASGAIRPYSLCGDPKSTDRYRLAILLDAAGRGGSREVHESLLEGSTLKIGMPRNAFPLVEGAAHSVLIAGGIGVTPLLAMAMSLRDSGLSFEFHYVTRSKSRAAFVNELIDCCGLPRFRLYSRDAQGGIGFSASSVIPPPEDGTHLYVCGPQRLIASVVATAKEKGWNDAHIHLEVFAPSTPRTGAAFRVVANRSNKSIDIGPEQTIADALLDAGIDVPLSCEAGICGTCITSVLEGIPEHRDSFLTDEEREQNQKMAVCCSRSRSSTLVLDI